MSKKMVIFLIGLIFVTHANAEISGTKFLNYCNAFERSENNEQDRTGYDQLSWAIVIGYINAADEARGFLPSGFLCLPPNVDVEQQVLIIQKYLNNNPQYLNFSTINLVYFSLHQAFPCQKQK